jgi:hypothetical protein
MAHAWFAARDTMLIGMWVEFLVAHQDGQARLEDREKRRVGRLLQNGSNPVSPVCTESLQQLEERHAARREAARRRRARAHAQAADAAQVTQLVGSEQQRAERAHRKQLVHEFQQRKLAEVKIAALRHQNRAAAAQLKLGLALPKSRAGLADASWKYSGTLQPPKTTVLRVGARAGVDSGADSIGGGSHSPGGRDNLVLDLAEVDPVELQSTLREESVRLGRRMRKIGFSAIATPTASARAQRSARRDPCRGINEGAPERARNKVTTKKTKQQRQYQPTERREIRRLLREKRERERERIEPEGTGTEHAERRRGPTEGTLLPAPVVRDSAQSTKGLVRRSSLQQLLERPWRLTGEQSTGGGGSGGGSGSSSPCSEATPELKNDPAKADLWDQKEAWQDAGGWSHQLDGVGLKRDWLYAAVLWLLRVADPERTNLLSSKVICDTVCSAAMGLGLSPAARSLLQSKLDRYAQLADDGKLEVNGYEAVLYDVGEMLSEVGFAVEDVEGEHPSCMLYDPGTGAMFRYNWITGETEWEGGATESTLPAPSATSASVVASATLPGLPTSDSALYRALIHRLKAACMFVPGADEHRIEEDVFFLILQSSLVGLGLSTNDATLLRDEMPPEEDGLVGYLTACEEVGLLIQEVYLESRAHDLGNDWCLLYSPLDGLFHYNKRSMATSAARPLNFKYRLSSTDVEDYLFALCRQHDPGNSGMIAEDSDEETGRPGFWSLLELEAPAGLGIADRINFALMQKFDQATGSGHVPWRKFVPLFRGLVAAVHAEQLLEQGSSDTLDTWITIDTTVGDSPFHFHFDRATGRSDEPL